MRCRSPGPLETGASSHPGAGGRSSRCAGPRGRTCPPRRAAPAHGRLPAVRSPRVSGVRAPGRQRGPCRCPGVPGVWEEGWGAGLGASRMPSVATCSPSTCFTALSTRGCVRQTSNTPPAAGTFCRLAISSAPATSAAARLWRVQSIVSTSCGSRMEGSSTKPLASSCSRSAALSSVAPATMPSAVAIGQPGRHLMTRADPGRQ